MLLKELEIKHPKVYNRIIECNNNKEVRASSDVPYKLSGDSTVYQAIVNFIWCGTPETQYVWSKALYEEFHRFYEFHNKNNKNNKLINILQCT